MLIFCKTQTVVCTNNAAHFAKFYIHSQTLPLAVMPLSSSAILQLLPVNGWPAYISIAQINTITNLILWIFGRVSQFPQVTAPHQTIIQQKGLRCYVQAHTTHARPPHTAESPNHKCIPATCTLLAPASGVQVSSAQHGGETSKQASKHRQPHYFLDCCKCTGSFAIPIIFLNMVNLVEARALVKMSAGLYFPGMRM